VDFVICPADNERLEVLVDEHVAGQPVPLVCPACGKRYLLGRDGLRDAPGKGR
jgi:uncharacterized protein YbaR (Trm112 family)